MRERRYAPVVITAGAVVALLGSFLPWLRSGQRLRSSYELSTVAGRLDLVHGAVASGGLAVWPLVPLLTVAAVMAAWWGRPLIAAALSAVTALYVLVICIATWRSPRPAQPGVAITFAGASLLLAAGVTYAVTARP